MFEAGALVRFNVDNWGIITRTKELVTLKANTVGLVLTSEENSSFHFKKFHLLLLIDSSLCETNVYDLYDYSLKQIESL